MLDRMYRIALVSLLCRMKPFPNKIDPIETILKAKLDESERSLTMQNEYRRTSSIEHPKVS